MPAEDPARQAPPGADEQRETDDLPGGTDERVRDTTMEHEVLGARSGKSNQELAQVGRVPREDPDRGGARHVTIRDGAHECRADERVREVVHATRCGKTSRHVQRGWGSDFRRSGGAAAGTRVRAVRAVGL